MFRSSRMVMGSVVGVSLLVLALPIPSRCLAAVFEPMQSERTKFIYANGQAIAVTRSDSATVWLMLEGCDVLGTKYLRLWCMYQNLRAHEVLFEPQVSCSLHIMPLGDPSSSASKTRPGIRLEVGPTPPVTIGPESPTHLLKQISAAKNMDLIVTAIGGALMTAHDVASARSTHIEGTGGARGTGYTVNDREEKQRAESRRNAALVGGLMGDIERSYEVFQSSISIGVLRKNTVYPAGAVNGYLYFPRFENYAWRKQFENDKGAKYEKMKTVERATRYPEKNAFEARIIAQGDTMRVVFNPRPDE